MNPDPHLLSEGGCQVTGINTQEVQIRKKPPQAHGRYLTLPTSLGQPDLIAQGVFHLARDTHCYILKILLAG